MKMKNKNVRTQKSIRSCQNLFSLLTFYFNGMPLVALPPILPLHAIIATYIRAKTEGQNMNSQKDGKHRL